jgi:hypothetical protein
MGFIGVAAIKARSGLIVKKLEPIFQPQIDNVSQSVGKWQTMSVLVIYILGGSHIELGAYDITWLQLLQ